jgi:hypothetical protein
MKSLGFFAQDFSSNKTHVFTIIAFQPYPQIDDPFALTDIVSLPGGDSLL